MLTNDPCSRGDGSFGVGWLSCSAEWAARSRAVRGRPTAGEDYEELERTDVDSSPVSDAERARLTLSKLWAVTHARLDHCHGIALGQARKSFPNAQIAMALGFVLLVDFVVIAFQASSVVGSVVAGGLGAVSAALAGDVSRTFVRSQEVAVGHLRAYFDQPLEFSRFLAAERLVAESNLSDE
ncbi:hypothetical protein ACIHCV_21975 [Streptomyces sp. NPDC051956]|uniref:hypothetical protein n=1 Tax=Streptomyces sp. NPDC051956 TaxID=3365677 RepID=UPI0037D829F2